MRYYLKELVFAATRAATLRSAAALIARTALFHLRRKRTRAFDAPRAYQLRLDTTPQPVHLRTYAGDLFVFYEIMVGRVYDTAELDLPHAPNIIDLGANVGIATLHFASSHTHARILAVEPDAENLHVLRLNVAPYADRVRVLAAAVAGERGSRAFAGEGAAWGRGFRESGPAVDALSVADVIEHSGFDRVHLLKIDVEGAEAEIFRGDIDWLRRVDHLLIELHGDPDEGRFGELMSNYGFEVFRTRFGTVAARITRSG